MTTIQRVTSPFDLRTFIGLPWKIYEGNLYWVPPLKFRLYPFFNPKKNPFYRHADMELYLAWRNKEPVGRIACILDASHNQFHNEKMAAFGFFDCVPEESVAHQLLDHARQWGQTKGMEVLRGPLNPSTNHECGLLIQGFDRSPSIGMPYNPATYPVWFETFGLRKAQDLLAYEMKKNRVEPSLRKIASRLEKNERITVEPLDTKHFAKVSQQIYSLYNSIWARNWGFRPMTQEEFQHIASDFRPLIRPDLALVAKVDGQATGFSLCLWDPAAILRKLNGRLFPFGFLRLLWADKTRWPVRLATLGVLPPFRRRGIEAILCVRSYDIWAARQDAQAELSWVLEDNRDMNHAIVNIGGVISKRYRIYEMKL